MSLKPEASVCHTGLLSLKPDANACYVGLFLPHECGPTGPYGHCGFAACWRSCNQHSSRWCRPVCPVWPSPLMCMCCLMHMLRLTCHMWHMPSHFSHHGWSTQADVLNFMWTRISSATMFPWMKPLPKWTMRWVVAVLTVPRTVLCANIIVSVS